MTEKEIIDRANAALAAEFELDLADLVPDADLREDLNLDSLDAVDMVIVLEQEFGIKISQESEVRGIKTIRDLHEFLMKMHGECLCMAE
jgi:acyl carrier protein